MNINTAANFVEKTGDNVLTKLAHFAVGKIQKNEQSRQFLVTN